MEILIINRDSETKIENIEIIDAYEVKDKKLQRFIYAPVINKTNKQKFYIETNLMRVVQVNASSNYIIVSPDPSAKTVFEKLDDHALNLLQTLCDEHSEFININRVVESESDNLELIPIIDPDTGNMKIKFDKESEIKCKGQPATINDISVNDMVKTLTCLECINIHPDENVAYNRLHTAYTDITKEVIKHKREKLGNHVFFSRAEDYYASVVLDEYDTSYIHTEKVNCCVDDDVEETEQMVSTLPVIVESVAVDETSNVEEVVPTPLPVPVVTKRNTRVTNERKPRKSKSS